ncbi:MAG: FAD-dependent oxidoreductase [Candidatus Cloacimonetes bacterium]|nr:FAD-dependent oxidoreductase [Candidatus Cloacimonadota bacterium]
MISDSYDVIVAGGGTAGIPAAIAAARNGAKALIIEENGHLGGTAVMGVPFLGAFDGNGKQVACGLFQEIVQRLIDENGSIGHVHGARWANGREFVLTPFDSEIFKYAAQEMVLESGAEILLHSFITGVSMDGNRVTGVDITSKSGTKHINAKAIIDCTGDADIASLCGAETLKKTHVQNSSILFTLNGVDTQRLEKALEKGENINGWGSWHTRTVEARKLDSGSQSYVHIAGHFTPFGNDKEVTFTAVSGRDGEVYLNASRITGIDGTDSESLTHGEIEERRNIHALVQGLRENVPGFEHAYVSKTSELGIRESRTIIGDYFLTGEDTFGGKDFPDSIARGAYPSDIHDPKGGRTQFIFIKGGGSYGIPYRCLLPKEIEGLLVAGRTISAAQDANGTVRLQSTVICQGQAAGTAAALAVKNRTTPRLVNINTLRNTLTSQGACI